MDRCSRATRTTRATAIVLVLLATLLSTPRASAGFLGRHTILGKVFRMTPVGRVVRHFEDRRDDYRAAQQWLDEQLAGATKRDAELKQLYRQRQIDTRTYVEARTLNERRKAEYTELKDRMTRITRDRFQRAMAQEVLDRLVPRILAHQKLQKTLGEVNEAFEIAFGADAQDVSIRYETWIYYDDLTALTFLDGILIEGEPLEPVEATAVAPAWHSPLDFRAEMSLDEVQALLAEGDLAQVSVPPELGQDMVLYAGEQIVVGFTAGRLEYVETLALQGVEEVDAP